MPTVAVRLGERRKLDIRRDNHLKVVTAAIAKIGEGRMLEVATQEIGIGKLAMRRNKLRPERRLVWAIAHAPNENKISDGWREGAWLRVEGGISLKVRSRDCQPFAASSG